MTDPRLPTLRALAQQLLALEAANHSAADDHRHEALRVLEKLRRSLSRVSGPDSFTALLRRALALARADFPTLQIGKVDNEGHLDGLEGLFAADAGAGTEATTAIITHLLGLLATFVGEVLMFRIVRDAWPDTSIDA